MATMEEANKKLDMIDMKTLEIFSEMFANWEGKYEPMPDAPDHFKNPKTGEYTVVAAMKCASCGQLIPKPEIPADLLPPPPPPEEKGSKMAEIAGKQKYMQAKAMAMMKSSASTSARSAGRARGPGRRRRVKRPQRG